MTLPHYLKVLRLYLQEGWEKDPTTPKADIKIYEDTRKAQEKKGAGANVSDAKKFLRDSVGIIVRLLRQEEVGNEADILGDASQVALAIRNEEELLRQIAPDFSVNPTGRWPGPVGYRSALNHLIAVSIRVHSMYPETKFDVILRAAARRILVPALAPISRSCEGAPRRPLIICSSLTPVSIVCAAAISSSTQPPAS